MGTHPLLIVGAGPYGLSAAAYARHSGIETVLIGKPMSFWRDNMPAGMLLRSPFSWHLDPLDRYTFARYVDHLGRSLEQVMPIPVELYLGYAQWFQEQAGIEPMPLWVQTLRRTGDVFEAELDTGERMVARNVVVATGLGNFMNIPDEIVRDLPRERYFHAAELVHFDSLAGKRCLIVGGRQSAFEWAALIRESVDAHIHLSYRHPTPAFASGDDRWMNTMLEETRKDPGWYQHLPKSEQEALRLHAWQDGRLKIEPWLKPRIEGKVELHPDTRITRGAMGAGGDIEVTLDNDVTLQIDYVILATGYIVDVKRIPCLCKETILPALPTADGYPVLDDHYQSGIPGLYFTGQAAARDFGPYYWFTIGARPAARAIGDSVARRLRGEAD